VDGAFRWRDAETVLNAVFDAEQLRGIRPSINGFEQDLFADAPYRSHLAGVLARKAVVLATGPPPRVVVISHGSQQRHQ
jgi:carbon-monoxide dehydrogenase medium subunit